VHACLLSLQFSRSRSASSLLFQGFITFNFYYKYKRASSSNGTEREKKKTENMIDIMSSEKNREGTEIRSEVCVKEIPHIITFTAKFHPPPP